MLCPSLVFIKASYQTQDVYFYNHFSMNYLIKYWTLGLERHMSEGSACLFRSPEEGCLLGGRQQENVLAAPSAIRTQGGSMEQLRLLSKKTEMFG